MACSMTARMYRRVPVRVIVSRKSTARIASVCDRRNCVTNHQDSGDTDDRAGNVKFGGRRTYRR